jgi:serine/threonine-protein kinase RsbW
MVEDKLALKIESNQDNIIKIEEFIEKVSEEYGIKDEMYGNVLIALSEGANNAIFHGNQEDPSKFVTLKVVDKTDDHVKFSIADEGPGFDYESLPDPIAPENLEKPTGRGVFLMQQLADETEFLNEGSEIVLTFNF